MENDWPTEPTHPLLLICFDRPEIGAAVLANIWKTQSEIFLFRDGGGNPTHRAVYEDLFKEIRTLRSIYGWKTHIRMEEKNLGGCHGPATALKWFFEQVPMGIVLEEDIMPHTAMIPIYSEGLDAFQHDRSVFALGAAPNRNVPTADGITWTRSPLFLVWGWASWADRILPSLIPNPNHDDGQTALSRFQTLTAKLYMDRELTQLKKSPESCWSYHLQTKVLAEGLDVLIPRTKLTQNLGIAPDARRTKDDFDDAPNTHDCTQMQEMPLREGPHQTPEWVKWQKSIEIAKFRGIIHEIRNRLRIRSRIKALLGINITSEKPPETQTTDPQA